MWITLPFSNQLLTSHTFHMSNPGKSENVVGGDVVLAYPPARVHGLDHVYTYTKIQRILQ